MLQQSAITGILFLVGICTNSRLMALGGIIGSLSGIFTARLCRYQPDDIARGLYGFNGVLAGIALSDRFQNNAMMLLAGVVLSVMIARGFQVAGIPALTAPFVLSTWIVILLDRKRFGATLYSKSPAEP